MSSDKREPKHGFSLGTVIVIALSVIAAVGCMILFPILRSSGDLRSDTREFVNVLEDAMHSRDASTANGRAENAEAVISATFAPTVTTASMQMSKISFTFAGAFSFGKSIQGAVRTSGAGYAPLLDSIAPEMTGDIAVASLENVLTEQGGTASGASASPNVLDALTAAKVDLALLGHEHAIDFGKQGVIGTLERLRAAQISSTGLRADASADRFLHFSVSGMSAVVMHYCERPLSESSLRSLDGEDESLYINRFDINAITQDIKNMRAVGVKLVIVSLRWGTAGSNTPTALQREQAQLIADAGADIIIGAHSGVVQPVEILTAHRANGASAQTIVAYSLGSLLCDGENEDGNRQITYISGILLHVTLSWNAQADVITFEPLSYTPTFIWRQNTDTGFQYRVIASDQPAPETMISSQVSTMGKALKRIQDVLAGSPVTLRVHP